MFNGLNFIICLILIKMYFDEKEMRVHVLTLCTGYDFKIYERFVGSLYDTGFSGNVYLFITANDIDVVLKIKSIYPNVCPMICDPSLYDIHAQSSRYDIIRLFLQQNDIEYDYILLTDSRDVLFQRNIELYPLDADIYAFEEEEKIRNCKYNFNWIKMIEQKEQKSYSDLYDKTILCSGTILLSKKVAIEFLEIFCSRLEYSKNLVMDQGVYNTIIYRNIRNWNIKILSNKENLVNTVGYGYKCVKDNKIVNLDNEVSWIVHQYDRMSNEMKREISLKFDFEN